MPKCPKCNLETDHLMAIYMTTGYSRDIVRLTKSGEEKAEAEYDADTGLMRWPVESGSSVDDRYICPSCRGEIARGIDEAMKFLKGG